MAKRLAKVAKELNVGTSTIVEFLTEKGFEIDNRPTSKISDEMEQELLKKFSTAKAVKEKADSMVIGTRPVTTKEEPKAAPVPPPPPPPVAPPPPPPVKETAVPKVEEKKADPAPPTPATPPPAKEPAPEPVAETPQAKEEEKSRFGLKIKGKIDLDKKGKQVKKETPKPEVKASPKEEKVKEVKETPAEKPAEAKSSKPASSDKKADDKKDKKDKPVPAAKKETPKPTADAVGSGASDNKTGEDVQPKGVIKAEAPSLRGLKVLGKVELPSKKKKSKDKPADKKEGGDRAPRRRMRKRIQRPSDARARGGASRGGNRGRGGRNDRGGAKGKGRRDEVKEVSKKEIEDKIKATMARISGKGKTKRSKLARDKRERLREKQEMIEAEKETGKLQVTEFITAQELANLMDVSVSEVITACLSLGVMVSINQRLDAEIIELVATEFDHEIEFISAEESVEEEEEIIDDPEDLIPRAPIVTVMGHVDHGKTSLLDYIREAKVAEGEAGGITQHIGAYEVRVGEENKKITFLDTPGHEAFTAMRARGAKVTDVAIIIIAADDSIMPQTKEAISHSQAADVPMVFAINKIDKPGANPERIKTELAAMNILVEEWGGEYQSQDISAKTGQGIDELLEKVLLVSELLDLKANPDRQAVGAILEASLDKGRGYVAKTLIQTGTLAIGDPVVAGEHSGKVKAMFNERGKRIKKAGPSTPVLVLGLSGAPTAGERFKEMESETDARSLASRRAQIAREQANRATKRLSLDEIGRRLALGNFKELNLIVKGDFDGSVEALSDSLIKLSIETVQVNVIHKAVGQIIESDVLLASASDAIIVGFQVRPSVKARQLAEQEGVQIKTYSIIYEAIEEIKLAMEGLLEPTEEEKILGNVEVRETFKISKVGTIAGCYVLDGKVNRNSKVRLIRNGIVVYPTKEGQVGELASLKRFKDDVKEVKAGMECGMNIKNFNDIKVGDVIEAYEIVEVKQTLSSMKK